MKLLFVRLGSLGDIIHTVPAIGVVRGAYPRASIHWLVDTRHLEVLELVEGVDRIHAMRSDAGGWMTIIPALRRERFDVALDFQGLIKSAVLARLAGAKRTVGFAKKALREPLAQSFYTDTQSPHDGGHVIQKNLTLLQAIGIHQPASPSFPFIAKPSAALRQVQVSAGGRFILVNPGAAWPNKRWPPERFGALSAALQRSRGLRSVVIWGPDERELAERVVARSDGAAALAPPTSIADLFAICREASLMVSGDTGPMHIAAACGTPLVGIFGPTDPRRNGPWHASDESVSRFNACGCHHQRRCTRARWCLEDVQVPEVLERAERRLSGAVLR
jgi:lipopolysaccharide heptosyltransferase I